MTQREREIYEIIRAMPMLEQSDIAQKLNITRSSVAVHIANLQKKGYILGRGYLLKEQDYIVGIGAANVDIHGRSKRSIILRDSNPGHMSSSAGGVTRNVSENLARLGASVKLITALGDDIYAEQIRNECSGAGIDFSHSMVVENHPSSTYISILDEQGDMYVAMSDMSVLQRMSMEFLKSKSGIISGAKFITCDTGLPEEVLEGILDVYSPQTPVFVDPVSCTYAEKIKPHIGKVDTLKPNRLETEVISGVKIHNETDLERAADVLLEKGLKHIYISLGSEGCFYMNRDGVKIKRALKPLEQMENATGGGDAFMAAVLYSRLYEFDVNETLDFALAAGVAAISYKGTINPSMSVDLIEKILEERRL
ncbi:PfkB family carbohydrate kinase [Anaerotignum sp. MB30-C6]|uniref:PfkB family carbohydrate kinase n=1 Tax=Anaerotignum sp. MB30-C6 TaxID=3070814 RepID=UPI0027DBD898|nr:PfkB family carbohydrate kinase [Anaerotignum sp. MB30-C6]WMI82254.1 PfkB family carbohydrate kinase [Anaerotignum sp. MB30-C6]